MQRGARADEVDDGVRVGIDGGVGDVLVPQVVGGKGNESVEACALAEAHVAACALSKEWR
jgi:hypothetical protein